MKGSFGRLLAGVAAMLAFSDGAKRERDDRRRKAREERRPPATASRSARFHPNANGFVYYAAPDGEVVRLREWLSDDEQRELAGEVRLLPRATRRRLVGVKEWRRGVRAPKTIAANGGA